MVVSVNADPLVRLKERVASIKAMAHDCDDDVEADKLIERAIAAEAEALHVTPATVFGAIVALEWAAAEFGALNVVDLAGADALSSAAREKHLLLALVGGAADLLRGVAG